MPLILIGMLLIVAGIVTAAMSTIRRGRMSQPPEPNAPIPHDTLEPTGRGQRLNFKVDLPGLAMIGLGVILLFIGSA